MHSSIKKMSYNNVDVYIVLPTQSTSVLRYCTISHRKSLRMRDMVLIKLGLLQYLRLMNLFDNNVDVLLNNVYFCTYFFWHFTSSFLKTLRNIKA